MLSHLKVSVVVIGVLVVGISGVFVVPMLAMLFLVLNLNSQSVHVDFLLLCFEGYY